MIPCISRKNKNSLTIRAVAIQGVSWVKKVSISPCVPSHVVTVYEVLEHFFGCNAYTVSMYWEYMHCKKGASFQKLLGLLFHFESVVPGKVQLKEDEFNPFFGLLCQSAIFFEPILKGAHNIVAAMHPLCTATTVHVTVPKVRLRSWTFSGRLCVFVVEESDSLHRINYHHFLPYDSGGIIVDAVLDVFPKPDTDIHGATIEGFPQSVNAVFRLNSFQLRVPSIIVAPPTKE